MRRGSPCKPSTSAEMRSPGILAINPPFKYEAMERVSVESLIRWSCTYSIALMESRLGVPSLRIGASARSASAAGPQ